MTKVQEETPKGWTRTDLACGYYTYTVPSCDLRDPPDVMLFDPTGKHLLVAFESDAYFNPARIAEGLITKIEGVKSHLQDLELALSILSADTEQPLTLCGHCRSLNVRPVKVGLYRFSATRNGKPYEVEIPNMEIPTCSNCSAEWLGGKEDELITAAVDAAVAKEEALPIADLLAKALEDTTDALVDWMDIADSDDDRESDHEAVAAAKATLERFYRLNEHRRPDATT